MIPLATRFLYLGQKVYIENFSQTNYILEFNIFVKVYENFDTPSSRLQDTACGEDRPKLENRLKSNFHSDSLLTGKNLTANVAIFRNAERVIVLLSMKLKLYLHIPYRSA